MIINVLEWLNLKPSIFNEYRYICMDDPKRNTSSIIASFRYRTAYVFSNILLILSKKEEYRLAFLINL